MALRYLVSGGTGNWNSTTNWSASSGGPSGASFPVAADDVIIDSGSGNANLTINVAAACTSIIFDNAHTGNLAMSAVLTVSGNVTLGALMSSTGTANIAKSGSGNMTSNGHVFSGGIIMMIGNRTLTWIDDWDILNYSGTNLGNTTWSGPRIISVRGNFTGFAFTVAVLGSISTLKMSGTGNLNIATGGSPLSSAPGINIIIDTLGTCTMVAITLLNCTFTYTQGDFVAGATILQCGLGVTLDTDRTSSGGGKITFFNVNRAAGGLGNITLLSDLWMSGSLLNSSGVTTLIGIGRTIYVGANVAVSYFGDPVIEMNTSTNGTLNAGTHTLSIIINKTGGASVTFAGNIALGATGKVYTLTSGIINTGTTTVTINSNVNITINGWTFFNLTIPGTNTLTIDSEIIITNNLTLASLNNVTFTGTAGWTCVNFVCSTAGRTIILQNSVTYRTTTNANLLGTNALRIGMTSNSATLLAVWTLDAGAMQSIVYVNGTRIDSSGGQTVWTFGGTLNSTVNWNLGSQPGTVGYVFVY